ncbi:MAG: hypothetical protein MN733_01190, partial [Nitrososphaera sp.]|nr:hypothetical protein [Nitrososphaera sp.]
MSSIARPTTMFFKGVDHQVRGVSSIRRLHPWCAYLFCRLRWIAEHAPPKEDECAFLHAERRVSEILEDLFKITKDLKFVFETAFDWRLFRVYRTPCYDYQAYDGGQRIFFARAFCKLPLVQQA